MKPILLGLLLPVIACAEPELRQGRFHTPEQAKAEMDARWQKYGTLDGWTKRAAEIRQGILEGAGLWPLPERKEPPMAIRRVRATQRQEGYLVQNIALRTAPGFYLCGNLYLPEKPPEKMPVVLCTHGHGSMKDPLAHGRFTEAMQKRSGALARMGCAVFAYEMVGYGESAIAGWKHGVNGQELKLQLWNSMCALDFMLSEPGVDATNVAVTGESGGGTQAFLLAAVDGRVTASIPCVQVSSWFYGGCACESGLPIHVRPEHDLVTNNAEIAAVIAPNPLLVISDGKDWTQHVPELELPHLKKIYSLFGKEDAVENAHFADEGHDYGPSKRAALYRFVGKTFGLDEKKADEASVPVLPGASLRVFDEQHKPFGEVVPANSEVKLR
jgi:dienelactone hydrolase